MVKPRFSKADQVFQTLREEIEKGRFPSGSRFPGMRELAKSFGVSRGTIGLALEALEKEHLISRRIGSGVFVQSGPNPTWNSASDLPEGTKPRAELITDKILEDISVGNFRMGQPLPAKKALRYQFSTSPPVLNVALRELEQRGVIHRKGGSYVVGPPKSLRTPLKNRVYQLSFEGTTDRPGRVGGFVQDDFHYAMGKELANHGVSYLRWHGMEGESAGKGKRAGMQSVLGHAFTSNSIREILDSGDLERLEKLIRRVNRMGSPVVFFNAARIFTAFPKYNLRGYAKIFPFGIYNDAAGVQASTYLGMMGHRNVAFFSYVAGPWVSTRLEGAMRGINQIAGGQGGVRSFCASVKGQSIRSGRGRSKIDRDKDLVNLVSQWYPQAGKRKDLPVAILTAMIHQIMTEGHLRTVLNPYFEKAFSDRSITAWIGADPVVASAANRFLFEKGEAAPQRISVISLDDTQSLSDQGVTACDLGLDRMGYLAAHCLLGDIPIKRDKRGVVECPPKIIERGTVGRVWGIPDNC